jgi:hypothetical protein
MVLKLETIGCEFIEFLFDSNFYEYLINDNKYLKRSSHCLIKIEK